MPEPEEQPKLEEALKWLADQPVSVPPEREKEILADIRMHFRETGKAAPRSSRKIIRKRFVPDRWMPLAASIVIAGLILFFSRKGMWLEPGDLNGDGRVDIVDALLLSTPGSRQSRSLDLNKDGSIDEKDAAEIAARAVRLEGGRS